ncbi:pre-mRNA 3' end processing protein WDR33-like isoform X2 [Littorina saxatilis]|uniref:pre-mRNA 3' end processing protein WDR33-like isoform X2 n=1 Tax=Littorina saxatilis TaxID=31220 RepID=UPI0038B5D798
MEGGGGPTPRSFFVSQFRGGGRFSDRRGRGGGRGGGGGGGGGPKDQDVMDPGNPSFDGKRMRKAIHRKTVDYNPSVIHYLENRVFQRDRRDRRAIQPDATYAAHLMPPSAMLDKPMNCVTTKFVRTSTNKFRCPIFCLAWTPEGRRLVTGASSGEFTLWNGLTFNFETILQAHDESVRAMRWSHNDQWMVTADHAGYVKYWQSNMNNVKMYQGHKEPIRGVSFCPTDSKFATCSDDGTVRIWDFMRCHEEKILRGHGADVKCVDWHPHKSLVASGSKDNQQPVKLWDPRSGTSLATLHAHKHTVMGLRWNWNGNWLLTASRDHLLKVFDIRNMKTDLQTFKGHKKEATSIAWHPIHESLFASGGSDGSLMFWIVGCDREVGGMEEAHEGMVWSLDWHPLGHILVSGSNDHTTKFWTRNRPGDEMRDRYNLNNLPTGVEQEILEYSNQDEKCMPSLPGMGLEHGLPEHLRPKEEESEDIPNIPGLDWNQDSAFFKQMAAEKMHVKKIPFARPIPRSFEKAWLGQEPLPSSAEKVANKPGLLGLPPTLNLLLQGNPQNIPPAMLMNLMSQMQKQPQLMALGQQMLLKHQAELMQQQNAAQQGAGMGPQNVPQQGTGMGPKSAAQQGPQNIMQQPNALLSQPNTGLLPNPKSMSQQQQQTPMMQQQQQNPMMQQKQQNAMQQQQQQNPVQQRPALLQTPGQPMGMRPMMADGQNQFRPPGPGQPQFHHEGNGQQSGMTSQNQFGPAGPSQFSQQQRPPFPAQQQQPPVKENFRPMPGQLGAQPVDQDHRRAFPKASSAGGGLSSALMPAPVDTDLRRPGPSREQTFSADSDQDMRSGRGGPGVGHGAFPAQGRHHDTQHRESYENDDTRYDGCLEGSGYEDDQYGDYDARVAPGGRGANVDERYPQHDIGHGGYQDDMHGYQGYQDERGGPGPNQYEEEPSNRKRSWQEGPGGSGGPRGGPRGGRGRGGGQRGDRDAQPGHSRPGVYNGPAGPVDPRVRGRGGRGRGRGRGDRGRGDRGRGDRGRGDRGRGGRGGW